MPQYELNFRDYLRIIRKRKTLILLSLFVCIVISLFKISKQPPRYAASATVKIEERKTIAGLLTEWIVYSPADIMESQSMIIKGSPIIKKVALRLGLINADSVILEINNAVSQLQGDIETEKVGATNIIRITATSDDPDMAIKLANTVAEVYIEENLLEKSKQARATRQFIEEQLAALKDRFADAEERLKKVEGAIKGIKLLEPIQNKLVELEFELANLLQQATDKHPMVIRLKEQIKNLEAQLKGFSNEELDYARLLREVEVNRKLYTMLSEKLEESRIVEAQKVSDVSLVDPAVAAGPAGGLSKSLAVLLGAFMGLVVGCSLAFLLETLDTSFATIEDVENVLKLPVLGLVPSVGMESDKKKSIFFKLKKKILFTHKNEAEERYVRLIVHYKPKSNIAEAYRNIRTNLKLGPAKRTILVTSAEPREGKTTILINLGLVIAQTGAKTLLISSDLRRPELEKVFGVKKEPGFTEVILGKVSLKEALRNTADIMLGDIKLNEIIKSPGIENLWIFPCGLQSLNPTEVLEPKKVANLIEELKKRFNIILFDSPPILPITDASLLAPQVDTVLLVYEIGRTARDALSRTKTQLESIGAKISGIVLNHIKPRTEAAAPYPYYYKYGYKNYYAKETLAKENKVEKIIKL